MCAAGFVVVLGVCLLAGCTPQRPALDLYLDAVAFRELGQDRLAVDKLNEAVKADPDFTLAYSELGKAHRTLGEHERALAAFRRAAKLDPWSVENHLNLAGAYEELGKHAPAADTYARAAELDPNRLDAFAGAASCYVKAGQYARAQAYCEPAGEDRRKELLPLLARAYEGQKDYARAVEVYERLHALDGNDPNVLLSLGVACVRAARYDRAKEVLVSLVQARPGDGVALRQLGYCLLMLGETDQAMQAYHKSIAIDGNDWEAYRGLGVACMLKARRSDDDRWQEQAVRHWRRSLLIKPDQPKRQVLEKLIQEHSKQLNPLQGLSY
ncbi:MAG: tetratricopeptide repeat protein [Phycisphaerae bacterium]|nr:tetratricopeptide repeat protein [Phycisphaerae bacterium]